MHVPDMSIKKREKIKIKIINHFLSGVRLVAKHWMTEETPIKEGNVTAGSISFPGVAVEGASTALLL